MNRFYFYAGLVIIGVVHISKPRLIFQNFKKYNTILPLMVNPDMWLLTILITIIITILLIENVLF